jgi:ribosomal protein S12 methylthiotransferase accessory factor
MNTEGLHCLLEERFDLAGIRPPRIVSLGMSDGIAGGDGVERQAASIHVSSDAVLVGPWGSVADGRTPCGHCLAIRWQRLRSRSDRDALEDGSGFEAGGSWPILTDHVVDAVAACYEAAFCENVSHQRDMLAKVTRIDLRTLAVSTVSLLVEPLCPSCSVRREPDGRDAVPDLRSRRKSHPDAYRQRAPRDYGLPSDALVNDVCGALGARTSMGLTSPTTAPVAGRTLLRSRLGLTDLTWSGQSNGYDSSRDLAMLEGLERLSGATRRDQTAPVIDSYNGLGAEALDPRDCGVYLASTYAESERLDPFDPDRKMPWVWGYSLRDERPILVPCRLCYYGSSTPDDNFVFECSNGCASGGSLEEAILFGLLELVERDAFLLAWYGAESLTEIDLTDSATRASQGMLARAALCGYDVRVFDNRIDLAIPVVTGVAERRDGGPGLLSFAAGASLDPATAVEAALSEICTYVPAMPAVVRSQRSELEAMAGDFSLVRTLSNHSALFGLPQMREHARRYLEPSACASMDKLYEDWRKIRPASTDLLDDLRFCRDEVVRAGYDVIMVNQTSLEQRSIGLHSVCMIVPGLLPIDFGWAQQRALHMPRMFTALRRAGRRAKDLTETDLHRVPHPFP